jgi:hypothetical protein
MSIIIMIYHIFKACWEMSFWQVGAWSHWAKQGLPCCDPYWASWASGRDAGIRHWVTGFWDRRWVLLAQLEPIWGFDLAFQEFALILDFLHEIPLATESEPSYDSYWLFEHPLVVDVVGLYHPNVR